MADFYGVSYLRGLSDVDRDGLFAASLGGVLDVRPQLNEEQARLLGRRPPIGNFGHAPNLLQHFQYFDFCSHTPVVATQPQVMCQSDSKKHNACRVHRLLIDSARLK